MYGSNSIVINRRLPLEILLSDPVMILLSITPVREYVDNRYTDRIIGYIYSCVEMSDYRHISIKIEQTKPLMDPKQLQQLRQEGQQLYVEFTNPTVMAYFNREGAIVDSFRADDASIVETEE